MFCLQKGRIPREMRSSRSFSLMGHEFVKEVFSAPLESTQGKATSFSPGFGDDRLPRARAASRHWPDRSTIGPSESGPVTSPSRAPWRGTPPHPRQEARTKAPVVRRLPSGALTSRAGFGEAVREGTEHGARSPPSRGAHERQTLGIRILASRVAQRPQSTGRERKNPIDFGRLAAVRRPRLLHPHFSVASRGDSWKSLQPLAP